MFFAMRKVYRSSLPDQIKRSLDASWKEGVVAQVMISIFDFYLIPYALFLGASTQEIGFLVAIPNLISSLSQFLAVQAVRITGNRRLVLIYGIALQAILLAPVVVLPFLPVSRKIIILIALMATYRGLGSIIGPAWGSLVSDYLPAGQRGQYFGWRQRMVSIAGIAGVAFWGSLLSVVRQLNPNTGFTVVFMGAVLFRCISLYFTTRMADVPLAHTEEAPLSFVTFLKSFKQNNLVRFIFYVTSITFATQLAAPYFSVQMLKNLNFSYFSYTAVTMASVVASLIAFPLWGRNADHVGNVQVLKSTGFLLPVIPVLWMFGRTPLELILIEMLSGFVFSGFGLATTNFIYDAVPAARRVRYIGYYNVINSGAIFLGATLGGFLAERLPPLLGYRLVTLFLISAVLRFAADFMLSPHFGEVRATARKATSTQLYLSVLGVRPFFGENTEPEAYPEIRPPREKIDHKPEAGKEGNSA
ncbi:MAG: MFS transporter [Endomicrobiales bacterium]